jgi:hypothetical protein
MISGSRAIWIYKGLCNNLLALAALAPVYSVVGDAPTPALLALEILIASKKYVKAFCLYGTPTPKQTFPITTSYK